jgi:hypothetical protein
MAFWQNSMVCGGMMSDLQPTALLDVLRHTSDVI